MNQVYADLHLRVDTRDAFRLKSVISRVSDLGYRLLAIPLPSNTSRDGISRLKVLCNESNIDFVSRVDLRPRSPESLIGDLRRLRRRFEIIAVISRSRKVSRQAAKDRRVDILNLSALNRPTLLEKGEAELAANALTSIEIDVTSLLTVEGKARARLLQIHRRNTATAKRYEVPILISSGATKELYLRKPLDTVALATLLDLTGTSASETISKNPRAVVQRNREKMSPRFVAPGIRLLRRGEDC